MHSPTKLGVVLAWRLLYVRLETLIERMHSLQCLYESESFSVSFVDIDDVMSSICNVNLWGTFNSQQV